MINKQQLNLSMKKRFDLCANTHADAVRYITNRALQIAHSGATLQKIYEIPEGVWAVFEYNEEVYHALYILNEFRGQGTFYKLWKQKSDGRGYPVKMLTTSACTLAPYFKHKGIPFLIVNGLTNTEEYKLVENIYGNQTAQRSGIYYMNHIDEGLYILNKIGASFEAKLGYILHPIFQSDNELRAIYNHTSLKNISAQSIINAVEYRSVANEYLSYRTVRDLDEIRLSPLKDVNHMLVADKVQNRKDFELYHLDSHQRSPELLQYFKNWMARLDVTEDFYQETKEELVILNNEVRQTV